MRMESETVVVRPAAMADGIILAQVILDFENEFGKLKAAQPLLPVKPRYALAKI